MTTTVNAVAHPARTARGFTVGAGPLTVRPAVITAARSARGFTALALLKKPAVAATSRTARGFTVTSGGYPRVTRSAATSSTRGRTFITSPFGNTYALSAMTRSRAFAGTPNTFTSISVAVALPTFSVARSLTTFAGSVQISGQIGGHGQIVRWIFEDPQNTNEVWTVPMNPNKMTSPYPKHTTTTTATSPITGQAAGIRTPDVAVEWQFSGSLNAETHFNQLLYWVAKPNPIYITDHLGRKWFCYLTKFDPVPKGTSPTNKWRYTYTMSALVFGRVGGALVVAPVEPVGTGTPTVPGAPTGVVATAGDASATVAWAPANNGGAPITSYLVTSSPGGFTRTSTITSAVVTGLTNGTAYTFAVTATNSIGTGAASSASSAVTPVAAPSGGGGGGGGTGTRLFADSSLWNTIKTGVTFVAAADSVLHSATYGLNGSAFSHPMYFAVSTDPVTTFHCGAGWGHVATTITAPAPAGMVPTSGSDHVMTVLLADGTLLDLDSCSGSGTSFTATYYGTSDGVNGTGFGDQSWHVAIGTTAVGSPQGAGTILARDVAAGVINHGLCMAWDYSALGGVGTSSSPGVAPAVSNDCGGGPGPLPEGALLLIPAGTTKPGGLSAMGSALWDACAKYGVYITDQLTGSPMFYSDGSSAANSAIASGDFTTVGRALRLVKTW